ncbi:hypothetical protein JCM6882_001887 [Rhodosporidiobolus microsporus]
MTATPSTATSPVRFERFDPESQKEVDELIRQRILCGWAADKVDMWRDLARQEVRMLYWIFPTTLDADLPELELLSPGSVVEEGKTHGPPAGDASFRPIGHVAVDWVDYFGDESLASKEAGVVTLATFFILPSQQGKGLGSIVTHEMEKLAATELNAKAMTLSTIDGQCASDPAWWAKQGVEYSPSIRINERWYERIGYQAYKRGIPRYPFVDVDGNPGLLECVFMRKELQ